MTTGRTTASQAVLGLAGSALTFYVICPIACRLLSNKQVDTNKKATNIGSKTYTYQEYKKIAADVGVRPPTRLPRFLTSLWFRTFRRTLRILHSFDTLSPPNSFLSLSCLWWKTMASNDKTSPVYDDGLNYDLLPSFSRWLVSPVIAPFHPRAIHANVEIRTAFLDKAILKIAVAVNSPHIPRRRKIRLITFGGGYDTRSIKLLGRNVIQEAVELDLPSVVEAKHALFHSQRFQDRRPNVRLPQLYPVDLNNVLQVKETLQTLFQRNADGENSAMTTIYLFEAVFLYLDPGIPTSLLSLCSELSIAHKQSSSYLCLVDRLKNDKGGDGDVDNGAAAREILARANWELVEFIAKPGATRHMVRARLAS